jgi:hypothetical protein
MMFQFGSRLFESDWRNGYWERRLTCQMIVVLSVAYSSNCSLGTPRLDARHSCWGMSGLQAHQQVETQQILDDPPKNSLIYEIGEIGWNVDQPVENQRSTMRDEIVGWGSCWKSSHLVYRLHRNMVVVGESNVNKRVYRQGILISCGWELSAWPRRARGQIYLPAWFASLPNPLSRTFRGHCSTFELLKPRIALLNYSLR